MSQHVNSLSTKLSTLSLAVAARTSDHLSICPFISVSTLPSVNMLKYQVTSTVVRLDFTLCVLNRKYYQYTSSLAACTTSGLRTQDTQQMGPSSAEMVGVQGGILHPSTPIDVAWNQPGQTSVSVPRQVTQNPHRAMKYV